MTYQEILANARTCMGPYCKSCPVCNGVACKNTVPGPGAKGIGTGFIRNYQKWQELCVNIGVCDAYGPGHRIGASCSITGQHGRDQTVRLDGCDGIHSIGFNGICNGDMSCKFAAQSQEDFRSLSGFLPADIDAELIHQFAIATKSFALSKFGLDTLAGDFFYGFCLLYSRGALCSFLHDA